MGTKLDCGFVVPFGKKERSTYYFLTLPFNWCLSIYNAISLRRAGDDIWMF